MEGYEWGEKMLIDTLPLGGRPTPALRAKLTAAAFFEAAVAAAAEGNLDAAQKAMTSGRAALDSMGPAFPHTRNSWGWAARRRVDAAFARWEEDAQRSAQLRKQSAAAAAAVAAEAEERTRRENAEAMAKVTLHEELTPFDSAMTQLEYAAPSSKNNPFDDF